MDYVETTTLARLKEVIGTRVTTQHNQFEQLDFDKGGVSTSVNWQGVGDFIYCELMRYNQIYIDRIQARNPQKTS